MKRLDAGRMKLTGGERMVVVSLVDKALEVGVLPRDVSLQELYEMAEAARRERVEALMAEVETELRAGMPG